MNRPYEVRRHDEIPPLAWLLDFSPRLNRPMLHHGRQVELFDNGFFEGAWGGPFEKSGFDRSAQGLNHAVQSFRLRTGLLTIRYHHNFAVTSGNVYRSVAKPMPPRFGDFDSYYGYLATTAREVCANARHGARVRRYMPLTTLSTGYDSPACAVIAASLGCGDAIALTRSQRVVVG
jgi:hypothetical protein